jgi:hypothetical protein
VTASTYAGLFAITLSSLMYEVGLTRIFSVTMWYHFAFVAISVALFGTTVGALLVYLRPSWFPQASVKRQLTIVSIAYAVSVAVCSVVQLQINVKTQWTWEGTFTVLLTCAIVAIPFILAGIVVCLALTRFPDRVNRLYAADLIGAGLGCVLLALLLSRIDGPSVLMVVAAIAAVGALVFALGAHVRLEQIVAGVLVLGLGGFAILNSQLAKDNEAVLKVVWSKNHPDGDHDYEKWNAFSRVAVDGGGRPNVPFGWGMSPTLPKGEKIPQYGIVIDSAAGTVLTKYDGDPEDTRFLRYDVTNLPHYLRPDSDVLVVGVGGGRDILSALQFDQKSVTGVEINKTMLDITNKKYGDFTGHLDRDPRVHFVNDEARSYLARNDDKYGVLQISLIDTFAATSAGAFALSENSLYTTEAWKLFLDRLTPDGVLSVSRWYSVGGGQPIEVYRTLAIAAQALTDRGVKNPRDHILIYKALPTAFDSAVGTIMVSPTAYTAADVAKMDAQAAKLQFQRVLTPDYAINDKFAALAAPGGPSAALDQFNEDISPPTDDRPFFFQMADLGTLLTDRGSLDERVTQPVLVLGLLALAVLLLTAVFILVPLFLTTKRAARRGIRPFYIYFAGIGLGFLMVEFSQLLRLSVYLGHPIYALVVVLFSMLVFSGIGSMASEKLVDLERPKSIVVIMSTLLVVLAIFGSMTPWVIRHTDGQTTPVRILIAVGLLAPIGFFMGMPLAVGMRVASRHGAPTSFLWGINGATSVCGSVLSMAVALFFGISVSFWVGWAAYAAAAAAMFVVVAARGRRRPLPIDGTDADHGELEPALAGA